MPYIQVDETKYPLRIGDVTVGTGADARIRVGGGSAAGAGVQAIVVVAPDGGAVIRRSGASAVVRVNGVQLGDEPTPLIHGDKIEVAGSEVLFGDDRKGGSTQFLSGLRMADPGAQRGPDAVATATTGGRLLSLVDGREYPVPVEGIIIGRDAGCDVVVPNGEVSRRHAAISPGAGGYVVTDTSVNGLLVNGERIHQSQRLGRGDILRIGNEEFRFSADVAPPSPAPGASGDAGIGASRVGASRTATSHTASSNTASSSTAPSSTASSSTASSSTASSSTASSSTASSSTPPSSTASSNTVSSNTAASNTASSNTASSNTASSSTAASSPLAASHVAPSARLAASSADVGRGTSPVPGKEGARGQVLATLEVTNAGVLKGRRFDLTTALSHVGRGEHNDVSVPDESVSDSHAKLQKREGGWYVVDLGSTNGTYVAGVRITGEQRLDGTPDLRFGGVKMAFHPAAAGIETGKGTRVIAGVSTKHARSLGPPAPAMGPAAPPPGSSPEASGRLPLWFWLAAALLIVAAIIFFMQGRT